MIYLRDPYQSLPCSYTDVGCPYTELACLALRCGHYLLAAYAGFVTLLRGSGEKRVSGKVTGLPVILPSTRDFTRRSRTARESFDLKPLSSGRHPRGSGFRA